MQQLIDDCAHLPASLLPRQRTVAGSVQRVIDLTEPTVLRIPAVTLDLLEGYDDYGT